MEITHWECASERNSSHIERVLLFRDLQACHCVHLTSPHEGFQL